MNAPLRHNFDEEHTLVMPNRPGGVSGVMPYAQAVSSVIPVARPASGVMPVAHEYDPRPSELVPTADVLASYPPATTEPTPLSVPPIASIAPVSMSEPRAPHQGSHAFGPSAPSDGRGRVAFIILLGFLLGIGGAYGYQVVKHSPAAAAAKPAEPLPPPKADATPEDAKLAETKPTEPQPVAAKPAETKPVETKPVETKPAKAKPPAKPSMKATVAPAEPKAQSRPARAPHPKSPRPEPDLEGRDLLSEGLD